MRVVNTHAMMDGVRKFVLSGALPALKNVVFQANAQPRTDGTTIYLPLPNALGTPEDHALWLYMAEHELGHEDPVNNAPHWRTLLDDTIDTTTKQIWNLLSDHVQERNRIGQYAGRDKVLMEGRALFMAQQLQSSGGTFDTAPMSALFQWDNAERMAWNPMLSSDGDNPSNDELIAKFSSLVDIAALRNESDCLDAARKLRPLFPDSPSADDTKAVKTFAVSSHEEGDGDEPVTPSPSGGDAGYTARQPTFLNLNDTSPYGASYRTEIERLLRKNNLPAKLRAWLVGQRAIKESGGYRSGRLDASRLTDVLRNRDDVFRRKENTRTPNAAVFLLVDGSGSMAGQRYATASAAAIMMCDALSAAKASVRVESFTEMMSSGPKLLHGLWKDWDERFSQERMLRRVMAQTSRLANNADGESILWAYHKLRQRQADKRLLIVLSDGAPAGYGPVIGSDISGFTRNAIKLVESDKTIKLVGVGIDGEKASMYSRRVMVNSHDGTLERVLLDIARSVYE